MKSSTATAVGVAIGVVLLILVELIVGGTIVWGAMNVFDWLAGTDYTLPWIKCAGVWGLFLAVRWALK